MATFILAALLITIVAFGLLIVPLIRTRNTVSYERHAQNIHYARERLQELEAQLKNASISATDYEALKLEIESTLAQDVNLATNQELQSTVQSRRSNKLMIGLLAVFLPLAAVGFYLLGGTPETFDPARAQARPSAEQIDQLISDIEARLTRDPNDLRGWTLLSKTYLSLGRFEEARDGYLRVLEIGGESATTYAALADASALIAEGEIKGDTSEYVTKALALDPSNQQALWLAGLGAMQRGDKPSARQHWGKLVTLLDEFPEQQAELQSIIQGSLGQDEGESLVDSPAETTSDLTIENAPSTGAPSIRLEVSIAEQMTAKINPNDTVFVFARAANGPPAPLAVKRLNASQLPIVVTLTDADAMMSQLSLSQFEDIVVSARVSKSGQPIAQSGDIQSKIVKTKNNVQNKLSLTISELVE